MSASSRTGRLRRAAVVVASILLAVAAAGALAAAWLRSGDPLAALPRAVPAGVRVAEEWRERRQGRTVVHVSLDCAAAGRASFVVSLPEPMPAGPVPIVVVLGGLRGGSDSIREITEVGGDPGPSAFIGYDWPLPTREPSVSEIVLHAREFRRDILSVPGQVDAILSGRPASPGRTQAGSASSASRSAPSSCPRPSGSRSSAARRSAGPSSGTRARRSAQ